MLGEGRTINVTGNACYIEYVENCYVNGITKKKNDDDPAARMSDELKGERGLAVLKNLQKHGLLDENFYPMELSNSESAVLAYQIAITLGINEMWKVFSDLWNITPNALRAAYNRGMEQKKTMKFLDEITPLLNDSTSTRT
ncbi:hypothetical protein F7D95_04130 [Prevotella copri]|uniref:Uncharacterized protein n=1 Tax=Segatella copri TaxID=165179 RepID=A0AA90UEC1_9BACT|nr:hypothetical protein [Segatella copri]MQN12024.1 hypothetical protein [Segatella copri]